MAAYGFAVEFLAIVRIDARCYPSQVSPGKFRHAAGILLTRRFPKGLFQQGEHAEAALLQSHRWRAAERNAYGSPLRFFSDDSHQGTSPGLNYATSLHMQFHR